jgi:hypothetical protein
LERTYRIEDYQRDSRALTLRRQSVSVECGLPRI